MSIEIKGINNLIKRLNNLSKIETKSAVEDAAKLMEESIKNKASSFSVKSEIIKACDPRNYGNNCYIDVGLNNTNAPFDEWKELWFQQWGFYDYGLNFSGQYYINNHILWFDEAVQSAEDEVKKVLKQKLKQQIRQCWKG